MARHEKEGPRGGTTTRRRGQVHKTFWLDLELAQALRTLAFEQETSEASIIRDALQAYLEAELGPIEMS